MFGDGSEQKSVERFIVCGIKIRHVVVVGSNGVSDAMTSKESKEDIFEGGPVAEGAVKPDFFGYSGDVLDDGTLLLVRDGFLRRSQLGLV